MAYAILIEDEFEKDFKKLSKVEQVRAHRTEAF
jgi:mRNA-degrading endonuclease RelE of RelBE toxin-antitoxin system